MVTIHVVAIHVLAIHVAAIHMVTIHVVAIHVVAIHVVAIHVVTTLALCHRLFSDCCFCLHDHVDTLIIGQLTLQRSKHMKGSKERYLLGQNTTDELSE